MNYIRQLVREEIARHILNEHQDSEGGVIEEGLGSDLFRATTGLVSGAAATAGLIFALVPVKYGLSIVSTLGSVVGSFPLFSPAALVAASAASASLAIAGVVFGYYGYKLGSSLGKAITGSDTVVLSKDLRNVVEKRDTVLNRLVHLGKSENTAKEIAKQRKLLDSLTKKQQRIAEKLEKAVKKDWADGKIPDADFHAISAVAKKGILGNLSYLSEK